MDESTWERRATAMMEAASARVWIADARPAVALARSRGGDDPGGWARADVRNAIEVYRALVPVAWNSAAADAYGLPERHPGDLLHGQPTEVLGAIADTVAAMLDGAASGGIDLDAARGAVPGETASRGSWRLAGPPEDPYAEVVIIVSDRSEIVTERASAQKYREQLDLALRGTRTSVFGLAPDLRVEWAENPTAALGRDISGLLLAEVVGDDAALVLERLYSQVFADGIEVHETVALAIDGVEHFYDVVAKPRFGPGGDVVGLIGASSDVTSREVLLRKVLAAGREDSLTGLLNRAGIREAFTMAVAANGSGLAVIAFGIQGLDSIADAYGLEAADGVLRALAHSLSEAATVGSSVARFGNEIFAVLMPRTGLDAANEEAARLTQVLEQAVVPIMSGSTLQWTVSTGVSVVPVGEHDLAVLEQIIGDTLIALGKAAPGEVSVAVAGEAALARQAAAERLGVGREFRNAQTDGNLVAFAQPIVSLRSGALIGYELLARLLRGADVIPAQDFVPALAQLGLLRELDFWMINRAMELLGATPSAAYSVWVNVAPTTFVDLGLVAHLDERAAAHGADPRRLVVEILETPPMPDAASAGRAAAALRARGVRLALDDFGTGAAGPESARTLGADSLKIDGSFVTRAGMYPMDRSVVTGAVAIARSSGATTVAEWVEDEETRDLMVELGVDAAQGAFIGLPAPIAA